MADLIELILAEDGETLLRKDTKLEVEGKPVGCSANVRFESNVSRIDHNFDPTPEFEIRKKKGILESAPKGADAYVEAPPGEINYISSSRSHEPSHYLLPVQFYKIKWYAGRLGFKTLYEKIVARIEQHPEVELVGQLVDHGPFADVNINMYVVPHHIIRDASKLNEILYNLVPEGIKPTQSIDAFVQDEVHVLSFGILGFKVEIGEKRTLESYTGMEPEELLKKMEDDSVIKRGVYTAGIRLQIFPHRKFVFQNMNGVWVPEKYSCGFYELDELEKTDKKS